MRNLYIFFVVLTLLISCAEEDPNLVNPHPPYQSIRIRLLNAFNGSDNIAWGFAGKPLSNAVGYLNLSIPIMPPPYDSITVDFFQNNKLVFSTPRKIRLVRETRYLIIAGKSFKDGNEIDTFMVLSTTYGLPKKLGKSYFKFVNLIRDSNIKVSLIEGCPNGKPLVSNVSYFSFPFLQTIPYGNHTFSLVINNGSQQIISNIYTLNFLEDNEYTLFVAQKRDGNYALFLYDDYDTTLTNLVELIPIPERNAFIRVANFSSEVITVKRLPNQELAGNIEPFSITKYLNFVTCESDLPDSIEVGSSSERLVFGYSYEVLKKYTLLVFDSTQGSKKLIMVPPLKIDKSTDGKAVVRVVNAFDTSFAITLSLGTRPASNSLGYTSGEVLAANLKSGKISDPVAISPGYLPLTLFSSTEPAFLINSSYTNVEPNRAYLIVVTKSVNGNFELSIIEDNQEDTKIVSIEKGYFAQFVNAFSDTPNLIFSISSILPNVKLGYKETFATVLPPNINQISVGGKTFSLQIDLNNVGLFIAAGKDNLDLFDISIPSMGKERSSYRRRFFNASPDIENVGIFNDSARKNIVVSELRYGNSSKIETVRLERKFSLVFFNNSNNKIVSQFNDIFLSFGKNYTLVFTGTESKGFSLIVVQEY